MHKNRMFYVLICTNNHIVACVNFMLSVLACVKMANVSLCIWQGIGRVGRVKGALMGQLDFLESRLIPSR